MSLEAYKIAVKLSLINNVSSGLVGLVGQFQGLNRHLGTTQGQLSDIEKRIGNIKRMTMVGGAMAAAGGFGLALFKGPVEAAVEYERAYTRFKTLNLGGVANQQADQFARAAQRFGTSSTDMMEALHASIGLMGGMKNAIQIAPLLAELNAANSTLFGSGKIQKLDSGSVGAIMRFNDMRGLTDSPEDFRRGLNLAQRIVTGSGGMIKFTDLYQMAKRGGAAFKGLSDDGVLMLSSIMQEQGGSATGTGLMSLYQNLIAGRTTKKSMALLADAGLAKLNYVSHGMVGGKEYKTLQVQGVVDSQLLRENPGLWLMKYALPAAQKKGAKNNSEVVAFINDLLSNRTGSNMGAAFTTQMFQSMRDFNMAKNAMGAQQTIDAAKNTAAGRFAELTARWKDLMIELGVMVLPTVIRGTEALISLFKSARAFATEFPGLTKGILIAFGTLAAITAAGGVLMLATAGFKALGLALMVSKGAGMGGMLLELAGGVGGLALALGKAGLLGFVGYGAYKIADALGAGAAGSYLGGKLADWFQDDPMEQMKHVRTAPKAAGGQGGAIYMDGRKVGEIVSYHQSNAAAKPHAGMSAFDMTMMPPPVPMGYTK